ncbi:hypothetical protein EMCRGX_G011033 [Ephydatia muelleri]
MSLNHKNQELEFRTACTEGNQAAVNHCIRMGVNVNCLGNMSALHLASQHGHSEIVRELLKHGANIDAINRYGNTALHLAILGGHMITACVLIEGNANLNIRNQPGNTPLHLCCKAGYIDLASLLLQNGADSTIQNQNGKTAQMLARSNGCIGIVQLFLNKEEKFPVQETEGGTSFVSEVNSTPIPSAPSLPLESNSLEPDEFPVQETEGGTSFVSEVNSTPIPSAPSLPLESSSLEPDEHVSECRICFEVPSMMVFVPCGHMCTCEDCSKQVGKCPICRCDIERSIKLYRA